MEREFAEDWVREMKEDFNIAVKYFEVSAVKGWGLLEVFEDLAIQVEKDRNQARLDTEEAPEEEKRANGRR